MATANFVEMMLTCGSWQEAQAIADALLDKRLIACAEFIEIKSKYSWQSRLESGNEIKLIMQSIADKFDDIEAEVAKLHSYETFVLQALPVSHISKAAKTWLTKVIK
jgi:periplasmic divalent cation tolerance protein